MTALLVRERRSFRIYSEYVEQNCCAYKETQKFLAHAQHPLFKGEAFTHNVDKQKHKYKKADKRDIFYCERECSCPCFIFSP